VVGPPHPDKPPGDGLALQPSPARLRPGSPRRRGFDPAAFACGGFDPAALVGAGFDRRPLPAPGSTGGPCLRRVRPAALACGGFDMAVCAGGGFDPATPARFSLRAFDPE
jgi:hypothetical protein